MIEEAGCEMFPFPMPVPGRDGVVYRDVKARRNWRAAEGRL
jgi:hypothetical protein